MRLWLLALAACMINTSGSLSIQPAPTQQAGGGTETCAEIVLNCDAQCHDPFCLRNCTGQGSPVGAQQHTALLDCGQSYGCMDETCMRTNCPNEVGTCEASAEPQQQQPGY
jgi:hypothetical protein